MYSNFFTIYNKQTYYTPLRASQPFLDIVRILGKFVHNVLDVSRRKVIQEIVQIVRSLEIVLKV